MLLLLTARGIKHYTIEKQCMGLAIFKAINLSEPVIKASRIQRNCSPVLIIFIFSAASAIDKLMPATSVFNESYN